MDDTHQALISEGVINAAYEEPEGPEVLKAKLQNKVCKQYQRPDHQKLQIQERTGKKGKIIGHCLIVGTFQMCILDHYKSKHTWSMELDYVLWGYKI